MNAIGEFLLELFGISTDPVANLRSALDAMRRQPRIDFFNPDFLISYGYSYGISLAISLIVTLVVVLRSLGPNQSRARLYLAFTYYSETFIVGGLLLFVARWLDTMMGLVRVMIFDLFPDEIERQLIFSLSGVQRTIAYLFASGAGTGLLKIEADVLSNAVTFLTMGLIIAWPLRHLDTVGPFMAVLRWFFVALTSTSLSMLILLGGAITVNTSLRNSPTPTPPTDLRNFTVAAIVVAAFAPFMINKGLKKSRQFQRIAGKVSVIGTPITRARITAPAPVYSARTNRGISKRLESARVSEINSKWVTSALKHPEKILALSATTRPIGSVISAARGLKRK